jgi:cell division protein FtsB
MNRAWFKQNKFLVMFVVAFVVVFGYVGWLLWGRYGAYKQTQTSLDEKLAQLQRLENNNPTPTENNVILSEENLKHIQEAQRNLTKLLIRAGVRPAKYTNAIDFAQNLRKTVRRLEDNAVKAKIEIPKNFRFGFTRYATNVPDKKHGAQLLDRLGRQLIVIQELTGLMIEAGVEQIDAIKRVEIEPLPRGAPLGEDALTDTLSTHPQEHYLSMPFELHITCSAKALQDLINRIATSDRFLVIRYIGVDQESFQRKTDETAEAAPAPAEPAAALPVLDRPPRLHVIARVDFIEVLNPQGGRAGKQMTRN